ncbi:MAG TPA: rhodanese-like domain-containing protein [Gemmatimonadaceae bacterium]|nr:rhodanese-like domain-containing protein [Gemmatimonadaceae bacterium]
MTASAPPVLSPAELVRLRRERPETRLLDVRTPGEFESQHIAGAYNVPLDTLAEHGAEIHAGVTAPVVLVCRSGQRARKAEEALRAGGMANLHVLDGGMNSWVADGQPVLEGTPRMSLERQVRIAAGTLAAAGGFLALFVNPLFAAIPAFVGSGLVFAGVTDTCAMGMIIARLPHNRPASCDVPAMVRALTSGAPPVPAGRAAVAASGAPGASCGR